MTAALIPARIFALAFATEDNPSGITLDPRTYREINNTVGPMVNGMAERGDAWNIAVRDDLGDDVTELFPCFT